MGLFEFIIAMTVICTVGGIITNGIQLEKRRVKTRSFMAESEELRGIISEMHGEMGKLRDRVRVLERLATDPDRNLAVEIEKLRREETRAGL